MLLLSRKKKKINGWWGVITGNAPKLNKQIPVETAGPDELVQMVVLQRRNNIKLYRNGTLITDYDVKEASDYISKKDTTLLWG